MMKDVAKLVIICAMMGVASPAMSQDYFQGQGLRQNQSLTAGIKLNIPFGQQKQSRAFEGAKLGFTVSFNREYAKKSYQPSSRTRLDLINFGLRLDQIRPEFTFAAQDVTAQFLGAAYANAEDESGQTQDEGEPKRQSSNSQVGTILIVGGAALVGITLLAVNEFEENLEEDIRDIFE